MSLKITFFSDPHGLWDKIEMPQDSDMIICAGDFMTDGYSVFENKSFLNWFSDQKSKYKILVAGNHDRLYQNMPSFIGAVLREEHPDIIYLENSGVEIEGIKFWGTPNQKHFCDWAFNNSEEELEKIFAAIPEDTKILISHAPQYGILDVYKGEHIGEKTLEERIKHLPNLKCQLHGHIHGGYGVRGVHFISQYNNYTDHYYKVINGCVVGEDYKLQNKPITFNV